MTKLRPSTDRASGVDRALGNERAVVGIQPFGEAALLVVLDGTGVVRTARRARILVRRIASLAADDRRWGAATAAVASVLVPFDPLAMDPSEAHAVLERLVGELPDDPPPDTDTREIVIPVRYGGEDGPDLEETADLLGIDSSALVHAHVEGHHEVLFLGFAAGFPYIAGMPDRFEVPRRSTPRLTVPAGSVAVAGTLTGIYPFTSPGGWRILGRTDVRMFDPASAEPARLRPGDRVRFVAT